MEAALAGSNYRIFPKLPIREVLNVDGFPDLTRQLRNTLNTSHFDFVVVAPDHRAKYAVEFDGPHHLQYAKTRRSDIRKNKLCAIGGLPLLRVTDVGLEMLESVSILEFMTRRILAWEQRYTDLQAELQDSISSMSAGELRRHTEHGFLDPSLDSTFWFDMEHPFPLTDSARSRLVERHGLHDHVPPNSLTQLWYHVLPAPGGPLGCTHFELAFFGIYRGRGECATLNWSGGHLTTPGVEVLHEGKASVGIPWPLIIEEDYDSTEAPIVFQMRTGRDPVYFPNLAGAHVPSICEAVAEYLALREISKWADVHIRN
jgi:hypothetical protein